MASYIQGVTDYIPQLQPFQPDYNFLGNVLQTRQSRYDTSHKQLNKLYGTLLYSPMLRDDNVKQRDQFFQTIDQDIKKMAGLDLSLQENSDSANEVFKSMYDNKGILKDMVWTKKYQDQLEIANNYKNCINLDECGGGYWEGGVEELNIRAADFKNASFNDALTFANVEYTPSQDVAAKAFKLAKDSGFKTKFDENSGGYIITTTNGKQLTPSLAAYFSASLGKDPAIIAYYKSQAFLKRNNWVNNNVKNYKSKDEATQAYIQQYIQKDAKNIKDGKDNADVEHENINTRKKNYENALNKKGVLKSDRTKIEVFNELSSAVEISSANKDYHNNVNNLSNNVIQNSKNTNRIANNFDELLAMNMLSKDLYSAAEIYAYGTQEMSKTADPFATQAQGHQNALENARRKEGYIVYDDQGRPQEFIPGTDYYNNASKALNTAEKTKQKEEAKKIEDAEKKQEKIDKATGLRVKPITTESVVPKSTDKTLTENNTSTKNETENKVATTDKTSTINGYTTFKGLVLTEDETEKKDVIYTKNNSVANSFFGGSTNGEGPGIYNIALQKNLTLQREAEVKGLGDKSVVLKTVMNKIVSLNDTNPEVAQSNLNEIFKNYGYSPTQAAEKTKLFLSDPASKLKIQNELNIQSTSTIQKAYDATLNLIDPANTEWSTTNEDWAPEMWKDTKESRKIIKYAVQQTKQITEFNVEKMLLVQNQLHALWKAAAPGQNTPTQSLGDLILNKAYTYDGGFVNRNKKGAVVAEWVKKNENKFSPTGPEQAYPSVARMPLVGWFFKDELKSNNVLISAKENATAWATEHYDAIVQSIDDMYALGPGGGGGIGAWDFDETTGAKATGSGGSPKDFKYDLMDPSWGGNVAGRSLLENAKQKINNPGVIVQMYDQESNKKAIESDPNMIGLLKTITESYTQNAGSDSEDRPRGVFTLLPSNADADTFEIIIRPNEKSIKDLRKGEDGQIADSYDFKPGSAIAIFIPKKDMTDDVKKIMDLFAYKWEDYQIAHKGLTVSNPVSGSRSITLDNSGAYEISGIFKEFNPITGKMDDQKFGPEIFDKSLTGSEIETYLEKQLADDEFEIKTLQKAYYDLHAEDVQEVAKK